MQNCPLYNFLIHRKSQFPRKVGQKLKFTNFHPFWPESLCMAAILFYRRQHVNFSKLVDHNVGNSHTKNQKNRRGLTKGFLTLKFSEKWRFLRFSPIIVPVSTVYLVQWYFFHTIFVALDDICINCMCNKKWIISKWKSPHLAWAFCWEEIWRSIAA